jgi:nitroimidazol reductase NimA-like FMN-containing flavoprotein (pyridoxamine 5'-phosphate oxidase superfamily)
MSDTPDSTSADMPRAVVELDRAEAMRLLASVGHGRVVFTRQALPAIRPVNHLVDDGRVIVRTRLTAKVSIAVQSHNSSGVVVAYEADDLDPQQQTGWSVVVTGLATTITDPDEVARYEQLLHPWVNMATDTVIAIEPAIITGIRIVAKNSHTL